MEFSQLTRRQALFSGFAALGLGFRSRPQSVSSSPKLDPVTFAANWYAQAEHGGFYQAAATGIYERYGLDVTLQMGGAGVNVLQLLAGGAVDFAMGSSLDGLAALESKIPIVTVAAIFQRDPQCLLVHPDAGIETLADLKGHPIFVSLGANLTYWPFLRARFGFTDDQKRPYTSSLGPFLMDQGSAQQGYITAEPYRIEKQAGFKPKTFLLADHGYTPYATTIETTQRLINTKPDLVQRFVDASIAGWEDYLQDPEPAHRLIQEVNPNMPSDLLAYGYQELKELGIVTSGDAKTLGIGAMTDQRWQELFQMMTQAGLVPPDLPYEQAYTLRFLPPPAGSTPA